MDEKQKILKTIQMYFTTVLIDRDIKKAGSFLSDEIICCDLNVKDFLISKQKVVDNLYEKMQYSVETELIQVIDANINVYEKMATFMAKVVIKYKDTLEKNPVIIHYTATLKEQEDWKICASHYSVEGNAQEESWQFAEDNIAGGILSTYIEDDKFPLRYINKNLLNLLGYTNEEFGEKYGNDAMQMVHNQDLPEVKKIVEECANQGKDWRLNHRVVAKDGRILHMLVRGRKSLDAMGREIVTNFSIDMTDMHKLQEKVARQAEELEAQNEELAAQQEELTAQNEELVDQAAQMAAQSKELLLSEKKFRIALAKSKSIIFDYDIAGEKVHYYNLLHPQEDRDISLDKLENQLIENEKIVKEDKISFNGMFSEIKNGDMYAEHNIQTITDRGEKKWYHFLLTAIYDAKGNPMHAIGTAEDITRQKNAETDLKYKAEIDLLTEIYNKFSAMEKIQEKLNTPEGIQRGVFMIIDIDFFKIINDTYGHPCGDTILRQVGEILKNNFRETDILGRIGGDEFCIFVEGTKNIPLIRQKADILNQEIKQIIYSGRKEKPITVSIGITTCNGVQKNFKQVYKEADKALYDAKQKGRDTFCFYEE